MDNENYIRLAGYHKIQDANEDAAYLKGKGIPCTIITDEPEAAFFNLHEETEDWIFLMVPEPDFEEAADLLELDPMVIEDFQPYYDDEHKDKSRTRNMWLWGGIFSVFILLRLLAEVR